MMSRLIVLLGGLFLFYGCETVSNSSTTASTPTPAQPVVDSPALALAPLKDAAAEPLKVPVATVRNIDGVDVYYDRGEVVGFTLTNSGSPRTNPTGNRQKTRTPFREYTFHFRQRARQDIRLEIYEFAVPTGRDSHTAMYSSVYFFPRRVIPAFRFESDGRLAVTLPTGEVVWLDGRTKEVIGGVVRENRPIDTSRNRQTRRFADIAYTGQGVVLRIDQRGEVPESEYPWGRPVEKHALIRQGERTCRVRANKLWHQGKGKGYNYFLFATDEEFRQKILINECGWRDFQFAEILVAARIGG